VQALSPARSQVPSLRSDGGSIIDLRGGEETARLIGVLEDPTGRRRARMRRVGRGVAGLFTLWLVVLIVGGLGLAPVGGLPLSGVSRPSAQPPPLARDALRPRTHARAPKPGQPLSAIPSNHGLKPRSQRTALGAPRDTVPVSSQAGGRAHRPGAKGHRSPSGTSETASPAVGQPSAAPAPAPKVTPGNRTASSTVPGASGTAPGHLNDTPGSLHRRGQG
jgi:hypothetical protein